MFPDENGHEVSDLMRRRGSNSIQIAQALHKDIYETMAIFRGERQHTLTPGEVNILASCLNITFEEAVDAANASYALNFLQRMAPPEEETIEARWQREADETASKEQDAATDQGASADPLMEAFALLGVTLEATAEQIGQAFRRRVKEASDGKGGYNGDMDRLVQAKELALEARQQRV